MHPDTPTLSHSKRHIAVLAVLTLFFVPAAWLDDRWFGNATGSDWITLDLRGLVVFGYGLFFTTFAVISSLAWYRHHRAQRTMPWSSYLISLGITAPVCACIWFLMMLD